MEQELGEAKMEAKTKEELHKNCVSKVSAFEKSIKEHSLCQS